MQTQKIFSPISCLVLRSGALRGLQTSAVASQTPPRHTLHAQKPQAPRKERVIESDEKPQSRAWKAHSQIEKDTKKDEDVHQKKGMSEEIREKANHKGRSK